MQKEPKLISEQVKRDILNTKTVEEFIKTVQDIADRENLDPGESAKLLVEIDTFFDCEKEFSQKVGVVKKPLIAVADYYKTSKPAEDRFHDEDFFSLIKETNTLEQAVPYLESYAGDWSKEGKNGLLNSILHSKNTPSCCINDGPLSRYALHTQNVAIGLSDQGEFELTTAEEQSQQAQCITDMLKKLGGM